MKLLNNEPLKGGTGGRTTNDDLISRKAVIKAVDRHTRDMRNVILCHLSDGWSDLDRMKREVQEVVGKWVTVDVEEKNSVIMLNKYPF